MVGAANGTSGARARRRTHGAELGPSGKPQEMSHPALSASVDRLEAVASIRAPASSRVPTGVALGDSGHLVTALLLPSIRTLARGLEPSATLVLAPSTTGELATADIAVFASIRSATVTGAGGAIARQRRGFVARGAGDPPSALGRTRGLEAHAGASSADLPLTAPAASSSATATGRPGHQDRHEAPPREHPGVVSATGSGAAVGLIAMLFAVLGAVPPRDRRRFLIPRPAWRPLLFVSLLERPG